MYRAALKNIEAETARRTQKIFAVGVCLEQTADQGYIFVCRSNKAYSLRTVFTIGQRNQDLAAALTRSWKIATAPSAVCVISSKVAAKVVLARVPKACSVSLADIPA